MTEIMTKSFSAQAYGFVSLLLLPKWTRKWNTFWENNKALFKDVFQYIEEEYKYELLNSVFTYVYIVIIIKLSLLSEHLSTFDENEMRDFIDIYIKEMKKAKDENDQG